MVTAQEAKAILLEQRRRSRERQAEYMQKMRDQGYKRIAVLISGEAYKALDKAVKTSDSTKSELLSDIIVKALIDKGSKESDSVSTDVNVSRGTSVMVDRSETDELIMQYRTDGMSFQAIADRLTADGIPTAQGKRKWLKGTIGNVVKRLEKGGKQ